MRINPFIYIYNIFLCLCTILWAEQSQYKDFDWNYIQTSHFDIYYYDDQQDLAEFVADVAESSYEQMSIHLRMESKKSRIHYNLILTTNFSRLMW